MYSYAASVTVTAIFNEEIFILHYNLVKILLHLFAICNLDSRVCCTSNHALNWYVPAGDCN